MARSLRDRLAQRRREELTGSVLTDESGSEESEGATETEVEELPGDWYVVHTYSGYENKVKQNLAHRVESMDMLDQIFEVVVPTQEEVEIKAGQRHSVQRKVFPGYVLVRMEMSDESWSVVRNTPGVTGFVGTTARPSPLAQDEVDKILKGMHAEAPKVSVTLQLDDTVSIIDGPFSDFRGTVDDIDHERGKVKVLVSFFGRETPVTLDFLQVEKET
ncbi:MAG: transcription termination/antitermination protein NusG [Sphaerobacteraceae bacterium]|nr:MAG: transcription termination/antitermination protein NusG [Sphaerobacteraceae bacterium]